MRSKLVVAVIAQRASHWISRVLDLVGVPLKEAILLVPVPDFDDQCFQMAIEARARGLLTIITAGNSQLPEAWRKRGLSPRVISRNGLLDIYFSKRVSWIGFTSGHFWSTHPRRGQRVINFWHGTPLKRVGVSIKSPVPISTDIVVSGSAAVNLTERMFPTGQVPRILVTGLPRNDLLIGRNLAESAQIRHLLWMPTYRLGYMDYVATTRSQDSAQVGDTLQTVKADNDVMLKNSSKFQADGANSETGLALSFSELSTLDSQLGDLGVEVTLKPHPLAIIDLPPDLKNIKLALPVSKSESLYESFAQYDAFITDYSSVAIDWALLQRPIFLFCPDFAEYANSRGFFITPNEALKIPLIESIEDLLAAMVHPELYIPTEEITKTWNVNTDGDAAKRIMDLLLDPVMSNFDD